MLKLREPTYPFKSTAVRPKPLEINLKAFLISLARVVLFSIALEAKNAEETTKSSGQVE
jgi:hypothetical protein